MVVSGPVFPWRLIISSLVPIRSKKSLIYFDSTYSLMSPIIIIWSPYSFHLTVSMLISSSIAWLGQIYLFILLNLVRCCMQAEPTPFANLYGLYNVSIIRVWPPLSLSLCHVNPPRPEWYLPCLTILHDNDLVNMMVVTPNSKVPRVLLLVLWENIVARSPLWKCPRDRCVNFSSFGSRNQFQSVPVNFTWSNLSSCIIFIRSRFFLNNFCWKGFQGLWLQWGKSLVTCYYTVCLESVDSHVLSVLLYSLHLTPEVLQGGSMPWLCLNVFVFPGCFSMMVGPVLLAPWVGRSLRVRNLQQLRAGRGIDV